MRRFLCIATIVVCACQTGCAMLEEGRDAIKTTFDAVRPKTGGYRDDNNDGAQHNDSWKFVGDESRAGDVREKETDGLTKFVQSPKARDIERNLGID